MKPVNFELSKELSDVANKKGIELPSSDFVYNIFKGSPLLCRWEDAIESDEHINAYTADEILEFLPFGIETKDDTQWLKMWTYVHNGDRKYCFCYGIATINYINFEADTPADALAKLDIFLVEEGFINGNL